MTKKLIAGIVFASMIVPALAFGATTNQSTLASELQSLIKQAIALLMQEVAELQAQLVAGNTNQNSSSTPAVACAMDAKLCPDGSYVGRSGPLCAFAACRAASSSKTTSLTTSTVSAVISPSSVLTVFVPSGISAMTITQVSKMPLTKIGTITIGASSAGPIQLASLKLTFSGNGYTAGSSTFLNTVILKDQNAVDVTSSFGATKIGSASAGTVAWTFPTTAASAPVVSAGKSLTLQIWAETDTIPPVSETAESLSVTIQNQNDLTYYDGTDAEAFAIGSISLPANAVPMMISSLSWGVGM